jgi:hypothetical protein
VQAEQLPVVQLLQGELPSDVVPLGQIVQVLLTSP